MRFLNEAQRYKELRIYDSKFKDLKFADGNLIFILIFADGNLIFDLVFTDGNLIFNSIFADRNAIFLKFSQMET